MSQPAQQQAQQGILGPFLGQLLGQRQQVQGPRGVIFRLDPRAAENLLSKIAEEPGEQGFEGQVTELIHSLSREIDLYRKISKVLSRPFTSTEALIIDTKTAVREVQSRMVTLATTGQIVFEQEISKIMSDIEMVLEKIEAGEGALLSPEDVAKLKKISDAIRLLLYLLEATQYALIGIRSAIYLNMPAETRSPVANQLLGFDIIR